MDRHTFLESPNLSFVSNVCIPHSIAKNQGFEITLNCQNLFLRIAWVSLLSWLIHRVIIPAYSQLYQGKDKCVKLGCCIFSHKCDMQGSVTNRKITVIVVVTTRSCTTIILISHERLSSAIAGICEKIEECDNDKHYLIMETASHALALGQPIFIKT